MKKTTMLLRRMLVAGLIAMPGLLSPAADAQVEQTLRVAAVVNRDIISLHDLDSRVRLALLYAGLPDTLEARSRVVPTVMRNLIDESLEMQEAARQKMEISSVEIGKTIENFADQNHMTIEKFQSVLKGSGVDIDSFRQQIRAELLWQQVMRRARVRDVHVGEEAVNNRLAALKANWGKPEYQVSEIFLPVETSVRDGDVRTLAERLIGQLQQGAPFSALASQFSETGAGGGSLGWVSENLLDATLLRALDRLEVGHASPPIRTADGYHILFLQNKRLVGEGISSGPLVDLMSFDLISLPSSGLAERAAQLAHMQEAVAAAKNCDDLIELIKQVPSASINLPAKTPINSLPKNIADSIESLPSGAISPAIEVDRNTRRVFAVCGRYPDPGGLPTRADIRRQLEDEQLMIVGRRLMRDLHRNAFIELRM